jgi:NitT/TauT family transport system substrate-binding protein
MNKYLPVIFSFFIILLMPLSVASDEQGEVTPITVAYTGAPEANVYNLLVENYGFYAKNGLKATPFYYPTAKETAEKVVSKEMDFGVVHSYAVASILNEGKKPVIVSSLLRIDEIYYITVNQMAGISTPADLKGKRIGLVPGNHWEYYLDKFLVLNGESLDSVILVPFANEEIIVQKLKAGEIDAGLMLYQYASAMCARDPQLYTMWSVNNYENNYMLLICSQEMVQNDPETIEKVLKAFVDSWDWYAANSERVQKEIGQNSGLTPEQLQNLVGGLTPEVSLTQGLLNTLESQSRYLLNTGTGSSMETPDYLEIIDFSFLDKVSPEGDTIIHD